MSTNLAESTTDSSQKYKLTFTHCGSDSNAVAFRSNPSTTEGNGLTTHRLYMANSTPPRDIPKSSTAGKVIDLDQAAIQEELKTATEIVKHIEKRLTQMEKRGEAFDKRINKMRSQIDKKLGALESWLQEDND